MHGEGKNEEVMDVEEKNEEASNSSTPFEEISGMPAESQTYEECAEAQKETNLATIMQTSSDEEVTSTNLDKQNQTSACKIWQCFILLIDHSANTVS